MVNLVLNKKVDQRHQSRKERAGKQLSVFERRRVRRTQGEAAQRPWKCRYEVRDHEDVVPVMVVGRGDICPSATRQRAEDANTSNKFGKRGVRFAGQDIPQADQCDAGAWTVFSCASVSDRLESYRMSGQ
jgi:hypothetical protein